MRILLVEDEAELAEGLARALRLSGYVVDAFGRGADGLMAFGSVNYDLVVLDLGLPDLDGMEVLAGIKASERGTCPVLILTARDDLYDRVRGLDAGADDYVMKPFALSELEARLRALLRRPRAHTASLLTYGPLQVDLEHRETRINDEQLDLPAREFAVLRMLIERSGRTVTKEALFQGIYGWEDDARPQAIEVYVSRLRKRLQHAGIAIRGLRGLGYRLEASE